MKAAIYDDNGTIVQIAIGPEASIEHLCQAAGLHSVEITGDENDLTHRVVDGQLVPKE